MKAINSFPDFPTILNTHSEKIFFYDLSKSFGDFSRSVEGEMEEIRNKGEINEVVLSAPTKFNPELIYSWCTKLVAHLQLGHLICLKSESDPFEFPLFNNELINNGLILKTSGSTSRPKLVYHPCQNIFEATNRFFAFYGDLPKLTWQLNLPLNHVGGLSLFFRALIMGLPLVISEDRSKLHPKARAISLVPTQLSKLLSSESKTQLMALEFIYIGGAPTPEGLKSQCSSLPISYSYGLTESFASVGATKIGDRARAFFYPGIKAKLENGVLHLKGSGMLHALINVDSIIDYKDRFYETKDEARLWEDGSFEILGRSDQVIISGGEKIDLNEVEVFINKNPALRASKVMGVPHDKWGEALSLFISPYSHNLASELRDTLKSKLGPHYSPKYILNLDEVAHQGIKPTREDFIASTRPLIFSLHGMMGNKNDLALLDKLTKLNHLPLELPGHGSEDFNARSESWHDQVSYYRDLILSQAGGREYILFGYSMGGRLLGAVAKELASSQNPARGLILESSHFGSISTEEREMRRQSDSKLFQFEPTRENLHNFLEKWWRAPLFFGMPNQSGFNKLLNDKCDEGMEKLTKWQRSLNFLSVANQEDYSEFYQRETTFPLLYLAGLRDEKYAAISISLKLNPKATTQLIDTGHNVHFTHPEEFLETVSNWLKQIQVI